jgi:hypothetical protein
MIVQIKNVNSVQELSRKIGECFFIKKQTNKFIFATYNQVVYVIRHKYSDIYSVELRDPVWLIVIMICLLPFGIILGLIFAWIAGSLYRSSKKEELRKVIELLTKLNN